MYTNEPVDDTALGSQSTVDSRPTEIDDAEDEIYVSGDEDDSEMEEFINPSTITRRGRVSKPPHRLVNTYVLPRFGIF